MKIEQRLLRALGPTENPKLGLWILADGTMVNGSENGISRTVDHHQIIDFFKHRPGQHPMSTDRYVAKFVRRGNIRMSCYEASGLCFELEKLPTQEQWRTMSASVRFIHHEFLIPRVYIDRRAGQDELVSYDLKRFIKYLQRYSRLQLGLDSLKYYISP